MKQLFAKALRRLFFRKPAMIGGEGNVSRLFTLSVFYNSAAEEYRGVLSSHLDKTEKLIPSRTIGGLFDAAKSAAVTKSKALEKAEPADEPRIIVPNNFAANGSATHAG